MAWAQGVPGTTLPLPVAYLEGSGRIRNLKRLNRAVRRPGLAVEEKASPQERLEVVSAARLPMGDTSLIGQPLRLRVHGLYPPEATTPKRRRELPVAIDLDVVFPPPEDAILPAPVPFYAWSFKRRPGWNPSPPVSFVFPLDWSVYPELSMKVRYPGGETWTMSTRFTLDQESGLPRLHRGVYLLGFLPGAWEMEGELSRLAKSAPAELFSVLFSVESEEVAP
ncbi:MAG TPA: hypothetical protein VMW27_17725 [Thermoanaerobaculia bacterium]|nr:hypothetical protein [Thermoanaerobaculia bacterium]